MLDIDAKLLITFIFGIHKEEETNLCLYSMVHGHVLLVTYPAQGHINPALQFAKQLIRMGVEVTFAVTLFAYRQLSKTSEIPNGLNFVPFSDGYDDGFKPNVVDPKHYMLELRNRGTQTLKEIVLASADEGRSIGCLVYTLFLPWAAGVARDLHIPSAFLWIQPATVLDIYYYYFHGYGDELRNVCKDPSWSIDLPGLPKLVSRDLPSFINPSNPYTFALPVFEEHIETLDAASKTKPKVLVNSFDALEFQALEAIGNYELVAVGPLIPSAFLDGRDPFDTSFGGDLFQKSKDYTQWLNSKPEASVVYISFGSFLTLPKKQMEEIARGLLQTCRPFLWVIRSIENKEEQKEEEKLSCMEELEELGIMVPWCSQLEVLSHKSLGCFISHCGWNSTLESLAFGVPVVAFPQWTDQGTNAKLIQDVWKIGVRVTGNEEGTVEGDEVRRCVELVMGDGEGEGMRKNAKKWKDLAREAMSEGGSSDKNLQAFVQDLGKV